MRRIRRPMAVMLAALAVLVWGCRQLWQLAGESWAAGLSSSSWRQAAHDPAAVQSLAAALAASAALVICGWLLLGVLLSGVAALTPGRVGSSAGRLARAVAPALIRNAVAAMLGVATVVPLATSAAATPAHQVAVSSMVVGTAGRVIRPIPGADPRWQAPRPVTAAGQVTPVDAVDALGAAEPGWVPTKPVPRHRAGRSGAPGVRLTTSTARRPRDRADDEMVVRHGDTLWSLAARHLGRDASDAQIALEWPTWFAANRSTIGADPDRLLAGMRLHVPHDVTPGAGR